MDGNKIVVDVAIKDLNVAVENAAKKKKKKNLYAIVKKKKKIVTKILDVAKTNMVMECTTINNRKKPKSNYAFWYILKS